MSGPRDYSAGTRATLVALSSGTCYYADCQTPVVRFIEGDPYINYEIAHIRDAKPGNRYDPNMSDNERRAFANLVLLCKPHHTRVDKTHPERYASADLQQWKDDREADGVGALVGLGSLTEDRLEEMILQAVAATPPAGQESAVLGLARSVAAFSNAVIRSRERVAGEVANWRRTWEQVRAMSFSWDGETGEPIYAEPSEVENERHRSAVRLALEQGNSASEPYESAVRAEVAAVRGSSVALRPWCDGLLRALDDVITAAAQWPAPPPFEDNGAVANALADLDLAMDALTAKWRGEDVPEPRWPEPTDPPEGSEVARLMRAHTELLEQAAPYARVDTLPYKRELALGLFDATSFAAMIAPVPTLWPYGLDTTAARLAAVSRNSDAAAFDELAARCRDSNVLVGVQVARHLARVAADAGRPDRAEGTLAIATNLLAEADWTDADLWQQVEVYARDLMFIDASTTGDAAVAARLDAALVSNPEILPHLVRGCGEWIERHDSRNWNQVLDWRRRYTSLPPWFPAAQVVRAIRSQMPHVAPSEHPREDDELVYLAAQVAFHARTSE